MSGWVLAAMVAAGWLAGWWLLWRVRGLDDGPLDEPGRAVAVIVPARDEAAALPALLTDLAAQTTRPAEVVVVDDGSTDATAAVASAGGASVVSVDGPPPGWAGKPWACWTGAEATTAPRLVFLDADVRLAPDGLARALASQAAVGGLLSVQPRHDIGRPVEALSAVANVVVMAGTGAFAARPVPATVAFGPCLVCDRGDYLAAGGHAAVAGAVAEDAALAARFRATGRPVTLRAGGSAIRFRMYPGGLRPLVEGWTKNLAVGAGAAPRGPALLSTLWVAAALASAAVAARLAGRGGVHLVATAAVYAAFALQTAWLLRRAGRFGAAPALLYPVAVAAFVVLFAWSVVRVRVVGSVTWRGRRIAVGRAS